MLKLITAVYIRTYPVLNPTTTQMKSGWPGLLFCSEFIGKHNKEVISSLKHIDKQEGVIEIGIKYVKQQNNIKYMYNLPKTSSC